VLKRETPSLNYELKRENTESTYGSSRQPKKDKADLGCELWDAIPRTQRIIDLPTVGKIRIRYDAPKGYLLDKRWAGTLRCGKGGRPSRSSERGLKKTGKLVSINQGGGEVIVKRSRKQRKELKAEKLTKPKSDLE